ncbi:MULTISPECIES: D-alanine--D-alanine ligase [Thiorhodovibrio]|uniref:D-alanine--D-alanine ligase n=1 Tax=Thiorhodovibrio TaxID=61593 RepID=UPI001911CE57|nr:MULTISPECIES: D-alanine--D-alanine ligase [Thiorhodovibrio]MBK5968227.1 D-alanine--D-alanine ligase [Thiorhodovibrio winogradskyi]WPL14781.1 D-alanine--D-alanine ligase [Thiorhodovibrio litoralis]
MNTDEAARFGKVAVLMGGQSAERPISLKSGAAVMTALRELGVDAHELDPDSQVLERLAKGGFERAFIILHGRGGEDGQIQGALETLGMPYTGSGVLGSAIGMDKVCTKKIWAGSGLPTADFAVLRGRQDMDAAAALGFPLMIKPAREGSSLGMARVDSPQELEDAYREAAAFDAEVIAESWLSGAEYTCAILDGEALPLIRLETPNCFYDFEAKYSANTTKYLCPCGLSAEQEAYYSQLCLRAFDAIGATGWGRVDFMLDAEGQPRLLEVNTVPGMTDHSLVPMAAAARGMNFNELVARILRTSLKQAAVGA